MYTTRYADCLHRKALILEVFDRNLFSANELLGTCRVDLHTVASGAVSHTLPLKDGKRVKGSISFDVVMQQLSEVHIQLSSLHPHGIAPNYPLKSGLALELSLGACPATTKGYSIRRYTYLQNQPVIQSGHFSDYLSLFFFYGVGYTIA